MSSINSYIKSPANEKKLENYRNRVNSLSNIPRTPDNSITNEKRRSVSESNASVNRPVSARSPSASPGNRSVDSIPLPTLSPIWDLAKLAHDSESLATSAAKEIRKSDPTKNGGVVAWIRKWSRKKQIGKVYAMFEALLPKLKTTEEEVILWLTAVSEKKESTLLESSNMLKAMETSINVYESYIDFYDELINDCLKISLDVSRELSDLRIAGAFNEVNIIIFIINIPYDYDNLLRIHKGQSNSSIGFCKSGFIFYFLYLEILSLFYLFSIYHTNIIPSSIL